MYHGKTSYVSGKLRTTQADGKSGKTKGEEEMGERLALNLLVLFNKLRHHLEEISD